MDLPQQYQYQALSSAKSTRLITLFPAPQHESDIHIELWESPIASKVEYEAVSYTWGDQVPTRDSICNGMTLKVTENVDQALRRLRSNEGQQRTLWIDALCINQQDEAEKTAQVSEMGLIYSRAKQVNVWLGHATAAMERVLELTRLMGEGQSAPDIVNAQHIPELVDGLEQLSSAPYWTRLWTIQEVALSKNCLVYLGNAEPLEMWGFQLYLRDLESHIDAEWERLGLEKDPEALAPMYRKRESPTTALTLHFPGSAVFLDHYMLYLLMTKKARDPHDMVFACRDIFPDSFGKIIVDYHRDMSDILRELSAWLISSMSDLGKFLDLVSTCPPVPRAPSWTLNLQCNSPPEAYKYCYERTTFGAKYVFRDSTPEVLPDGKTLQKQWHNDAHRLLKAWESACYTNKSLNCTFVEALEDILFPAAISASSEGLPALRAFRGWMEDPSTSPFRLDTGDVLLKSHAEGFTSRFVSPALSNNCLFTTTGGRMGLGKMIRQGDAIALISGFQLPVTLRPVAGTARYTLGPPAVLKGFMPGDDWPAQNWRESKKIEVS
ncbi:HET-domain-containing protein [Apiospora hydei]|uniref:HET-domain-containing protein n=1 Tax=Apiospora hydei TaxID=1337664 RepID=A0ABR1UTZ0_9PEZI